MHTYLLVKFYLISAASSFFNFQLNFFFGKLRHFLSRVVMYFQSCIVKDTALRQRFFLLLQGCTKFFKAAQQIQTLFRTRITKETGFQSCTEEN